MTAPGTGKTKFHIMMIFLVIVWGLEYAVAKDALDHVGTFLILNVKYFLGALLIAAVNVKTSGLHLPQPRDLPVIVLTTILGHIVYFYCEYSAMDTVPVANITIILGFLPIGSILIEKLLFHRRLSGRLLLFMAALIAGIFLTIGGDAAALRGGSGTGYLFCLAALGAWLAYLFLTEAIAQRYGSIQLAFFQTAIAWILTTPVMVPHAAELTQLPAKVLLELVYLGIVSEGLCFLVELTGLEKLGPTISAVYSNLLPVSSAIFGVLLLHQNLVALQYLGGALVILAGFLVIREKDRLDRDDRLG